MKVKINLNICGEGKIMLGKKDISKYVSNIEFTSSEGCSPRLKLDLVAEDFEIISEMHESQIKVNDIRIINPEIKT